MADAIGSTGRRRDTASPAGETATSSASAAASGSPAVSRLATPASPSGSTGGQPAASAGPASQPSETGSGKSLATVGASGPSGSAGQQAAEPAASKNAAAGGSAGASGAAGSADLKDNFVAARATSSGAGSSASAGGSLSSGNAHGASNLSAGQAADVATLSNSNALGGQNVGITVHVESLGNPTAMTQELLQAMVPGASGDQLANQAALLALSQHAVDNIPHLLVDTDTTRGTKLFQAPLAGTAQQLRSAELTYLASESTRVQAAQRLSNGPDWPHMLLEGLSHASTTWQGQPGLGPDADAFSRATAALYGHQSTVLGPKSDAADIFRTASLANAPLSLPAVGLLEDSGGLQAFVVLGTQQAAGGEQSLTLLDVAASLDQGQEVRRNVRADEFAQRLNMLVVPNGRAVLSTENRQDDALHTLGLVGCCLTSGGGSVRAGGQSIRTHAMRGGRGRLENRCLTCARAQQLCQPGSAKPAQEKR